MAKKKETTTMVAGAMPAMPESPPIAHVSMPKGAAMGGKGLKLGQKARVTIEGEICGFSQGEYGGSVDIKHPKMTCEMASRMGEMLDDMKQKGEDD